MTTPPSFSPQDRPVPATRPRDTVSFERRAIASEEILAGESSVRIDHDGTQYVLRATRAGKLILTK